MPLDLTHQESPLDLAGQESPLDPALKSLILQSMLQQINLGQPHRTHLVAGVYKGARISILIQFASLVSANVQRTLSRNGAGNEGACITGLDLRCTHVACRPRPGTLPRSSRRR